MWFPREMLINENTKILGHDKVYRGLQTTTSLRGEGERGKIKAEGVNCPKNFDPAL